MERDFLVRWVVKGLVGVSVEVDGGSLGDTGEDVCRGAAVVAGLGEAGEDVGTGAAVVVDLGVVGGGEVGWTDGTALTVMGGGVGLETSGGGAWEMRFFFLGTTAAGVSGLGSSAGTVAAGGSCSLGLTGLRSASSSKV